MGSRKIIKQSQFFTFRSNYKTQYLEKNKMMSLTVFFCLVAATLAQNVNINESELKDNSFFEVNTCDDATGDGRFVTALNSALTQWKVDLKIGFCDVECNQEDMCGYEYDSPFLAAHMARYKRQSVEIKDSVISYSTFVTVNLCTQPKFADLLDSMNNYIYKMKKRDFKDLCRLQQQDICQCYTPTTIPYYAPPPPTTTVYLPPPPRQTFRTKTRSTTTPMTTTVSTTTRSTTTPMTTTVSTTTASYYAEPSMHSQSLTNSKPPMQTVPPMQNVASY